MPRPDPPKITAIAYDNWNMSSCIHPLALFKSVSPRRWMLHVRNKPLNAAGRFTPMGLSSLGAEIPRISLPDA
jgi:hypothetical protein